MFETTIKSARASGVFRDFHLWSDRIVSDTIHHPVGHFDKGGFLFKLTFLKEQVSLLNYDYFVWIDADTYFVRHPGDLLRVMQGSPMHIALECDLQSPTNVCPDWLGCPNDQLVALMRSAGVRHRSVFTVNSGLFVVHHDVIDQIFELAWHFSKVGQESGFIFGDEPLLAYAMQMVCGNPDLHSFCHTTDFWASDWGGYYRGRLPDTDPWWHTSFFTGEKRAINPAIVHLMHSKKSLIRGNEI